MARRRSGDEPTGPSADQVIEWYHDELSKPATLPWEGCRYEPVRVGPTWQVDDRGYWVLPEHTIGWDVLGWTGVNLQLSLGEPWQFTLEQARFLLHWFATDEHGRFLYRDFVLQRLKGWGKDPIGATICAVEMNGPCRVDHMGRNGPVAVDNPNAWVQTAAVSLEQTKNTMRLFPGLFTREAKSRYGLQVGKEMVHGWDGERLIQAVTSSPATLEGARGTFVLKNETHHWLSNNDGHEMAAVIERNATKSADGAARTGAITNAYEPGEDSVAQRDREAFEKARAGGSLTTGLLYDSLEAPPEAPLSAEDAPEVVRAIRGDSTWLDIDRIVQSILDTRNPPSRSRRFWYNQITATEDAWITPQEWDRLARPDFVVADDDVITLGFDGSDTDDHTALIGCHVDGDHLFEVGIWQPRDGEIDRAAVDLAVRQAFERWDVVGFYGDLHPWESYIDTWAQELGDKLAVKASARHAIAWDMRARLGQLTAAIERLHDAIVEEVVTHDGSLMMRQHFHNARRRPNRWGIGVGKEHRESTRKIDAVPAATLARLARLEYLALPPGKRRRRVKRTGRSIII